MAYRDLRYTNTRLDTVGVGIEALRQSVDRVDSRLSNMADDWKGYQSRLNNVEDKLVDHGGRMNSINARNDTHSAQLRNLRGTITTLKSENELLKHELDSYRRFVDHGLSDSTIKPQDHYGRRQERPYFNDRDPPSFYKSPRDRVPPTFQNEGLPPPDMDRWERERRMNGERDDFRRQRPPSPKFRDNPMEDMAAGQLRKEMKRIELHEGNFKPYTDHRSPRADIARSIEHPIHRYESLVKTQHPVIDRDIPVEHPVHRYEPLVKTRNPRVDKTENPRVDKNIPVEHPVHRYEPLVQIEHPHERKEPGGVYLFIRNNDAGFFDVKKAYESHTGGTPERRLEGVADANHIRVKEGGRGWKRMATVARWEGSYYDQEVNGPVDQMLSLMWFPSIDKAREWVDRDVHFKHSSFPEPYGNVTSVLPTQYPLPFSPRYNVFMLTEFTKITSYEALDKYLHDIEDVLKKFDCDPFFINCTPVPIKSTLFDPKSRVVCHRFRSLDDANYFFDGPVTQLRKHFAFAEMTTVIFVLGDIHGK